MADINSITISGNLTADPELRYLQNGTEVCNATIASNGAPYNGETPVVFIRIVAWKGIAKALADYARKGQNITVTGVLKDGSYTKDDGTKINRVEIKVDNLKLPQRNKEAGGSYNASNQNEGNYSNQTKNEPQRANSSQNNDPFANDGKPIDINPDDLPF